MSIESTIDSWPGMYKQAVVQTKAKTILLQGAILESSEGTKSAPWMLQLVFNKILTFPLDQFWVEKHGCGGGREGGWGQAHRSAIYIKGNSLSSKQL